MAIRTSTRTSRPAINLKYSAVLGCLYVNDGNAETALNEVKGIIGSEVWKSGFTGVDNASSISARARALVEERGVTLATNGIDGKFIYVDRRMVPVAGVGEAPYMSVGLDDGENALFFNIELASQTARNLLRKLIQVPYGTEIMVNPFAKMGEHREDQPRAYADHFAYVTVGEEVVEPVDVSELATLRAEAEAEVKKLSKWTPPLVKAQVTAAEEEFFGNMLDHLIARMNEEKVAAKAARQQQEPASAEG